MRPSPSGVEAETSLSQQLQVSAELGRLVLHTESPSHFRWAKEHWSTSYTAMKLMKPELCATSKGYFPAWPAAMVSLITFSSTAGGLHTRGSGSGGCNRGGLVRRRCAGLLKGNGTGLGGGLGTRLGGGLGVLRRDRLARRQGEVHRHPGQLSIFH